MGLDMYLRKGKKIPKISWEEYKKIDRKICNKEDDYEKLLEKYKDYVHECGQHIHWNSLFEEVAYWRKANQIHNYFVENVQSGVDDCGEYLVSKENIIDLIEKCLQVIKSTKLVKGKVHSYTSYNENGEREEHFEDGYVLEDTFIADMVLPTTSGFFFGSTNYDEYYWQDLLFTIKICGDILSNTDFENEYLVYESSW